MALVNHAKREINAKIVYYGHEMSGKSSSLRYIYERIRPALRGEFKTLPASGSTLLFFDFSPFEQPMFGGYRIRFHIYTLQGKVANPAAWKMTLKGADGLVIVADASGKDTPESRESVSQLREFLGSYGTGLHDIPYVLQLNKIDAGNVLSADRAPEHLGVPQCPVITSSALKGDGVLETLTALSRLVMERISSRDDLSPAGVSNTEQHIKQDTVSIEGLEKQAADSAGLFENSADAADILELSDVDAHLLPMEVGRVTEGLLLSEGSTVRIPVEIPAASGVKRFVLTLSISAE